MHANKRLAQPIRARNSQHHLTARISLAMLTRHLPLQNILLVQGHVGVRLPFDVIRAVAADETRSVLHDLAQHALLEAEHPSEFYAVALLVK